MSVAAAPPAPSLDMVETLTRCAYELALAANAIAQRAGDDTARFLGASTEFRHCFFAVRMGIRLTLAQRAAARSAAAAAPLERLERERADAPDPIERERDERLERLETERERDRDYEPVSLPQFLKSLGVAAAQAEQRRDDLPPHVRDTTLPRLHGLLREAGAASGAARPARAASAVAILARPPAIPAGRSRLLSSTGRIGLPPLRAPSLRRPDSG